MTDFPVKRDDLRSGWDHFAAAEWAAARNAFEATLAERPGDPEALDGLGQALWWLGDRDAGIDRRRAAYAEFQRRGRTRDAARVAIYLAGEHRIDGRDAEGAGWLSRARRLLGGSEPGREHGWLSIEEAKRATDPADGERHARAALEVANRLADSDIECMALAQLGRTLVRQGEVDEGLALLDEAMTVALGGETSDPLACGDACCTTLVVCDRIADLARAAQWCEAVVEFTERRRFVPVQAWCRGIYGGVLVRAGDWERAEEILSQALRKSPDGRRKAGREVLPLAVLADLRLRQGRYEEADGLLRGLEERPVALGPLVRLHVRRGDLALAEATLDRRRKAETPDGDVIVLRGEIAVAAGDFEAAAAVAEDLRALAGRLRREDLTAEAALLAGTAAAGRGQLELARSELATAVAGFAEVRFPLEEARARLALAEVETAEGSPLAVATARAAHEALERLGARPDADRAAALLRELGVSGRTTVRGDRDELTPREREVLALLRAGLSNAEIAERLVIAPKTAEHHVSRVLGKLGVRSRTEAAAYAVREGI